MLAFALVLVSAAPALDVAQGVACVTEQASESDAALLGEHLLPNVPDNPAHGAARARLTSYVGNCAQRFGWDEAAVARIDLLVATTMTRWAARPRLAAGGIDSAALDRWFERQSEAFRTTAFVALPEADMVRILETLVGHEVPTGAVARYGELAGAYLAALVVRTRIERDLPLR